MESVERRIEYFHTGDGRVPYEKWRQALGDIRTQAIVDVRTARLRAGNFGHCAPVGKGVLELKINYGPGYRIYFGLLGSHAVLLLAGGDKSTQKKDIHKAKTYWLEFKERQI